MTFLRNFVAWRSCTADSLNLDDFRAVPGFYLGHTFACQPTSDELRRAVGVLTDRHKKDIEHKTLPELTACFEKDTIVLKTGNERVSCEFDVRKIVLSCVFAKNQKILAIFYHNDSPFISSNMSSRGLECHLILTKKKEIAKMGATKIGQLLGALYQDRPKASAVDIDSGNIRVSKCMTNTDDDIDYENISHFFRTKVFQPSRESSLHSLATSPSDSIRTFVTTACDSGRASTVESMELKPEDVFAVNGVREIGEPIQEHDEYESTVSLDDTTSLKISSFAVDTLASAGVEGTFNGNRKDSLSSDEFLPSPSKSKTSSMSTYDTSLQVSHASTAFDTEECDPSNALLPQHNLAWKNDGQTHVNWVNSENVSDQELRRLLDLAETDI